MLNGTQLSKYRDDIFVCYSVMRNKQNKGKSMKVTIVENKVGKVFLWFLEELEKDGWTVGDRMFGIARDAFKSYCEDHNLDYNELIVGETK